MFGTDEMKGWQAVPIIIPIFLVVSIGTIWYFTFHHFKGRPRYQDLSSPTNSSAQQSRTSQVPIDGPRNSDHLIHLIDIPPLPKAYAKHRPEGNAVS